MDAKERADVTRMVVDLHDACFHRDSSRKISEKVTDMLVDLRYFCEANGVDFPSCFSDSYTRFLRDKSTNPGDK